MALPQIQIHNLVEQIFIMRFLQSYWCPVIMSCIFFSAIGFSVGGMRPLRQQAIVIKHWPYREGEEWTAPSDYEISASNEGDQIRYGKELVVNTSKYLGPKGIVASISNGMNCQNCHLNAGTENFANPFSGVINNYPKYRDRSGRVESTEFRINECMQRSLNGSVLDSMSNEMQAIVAYVKWVGKDVPKDIRPKGISTEKISFLNRAADPQKGKIIYINNCQRCHAENGEGAMTLDSTAYIYPPLWGAHSYNASAGLFRLSAMAGFIKNNMPFGVSYKNPQLSNEEAWDVSAYIASQQRPSRFFSYDWKDISKKPFDYPYGPYADSFSETQHKYGPFGGMIK